MEREEVLSHEEGRPRALPHRNRRRRDRARRRRCAPAARRNVVDSRGGTCTAARVISSCVNHPFAAAKGESARSPLRHLLNLYGHRGRRRPMTTAVRFSSLSVALALALPALAAAKKPRPPQPPPDSAGDCTLIVEASVPDYLVLASLNVGVRCLTAMQRITVSSPPAGSSRLAGLRAR